MNTQLANVETGEIVTHSQGCYLSQEVIKTLFNVGVIPKDTPKSVVVMFGQFCKETGLNPIKRQVHLIKRGNKFTIQTGIDGYRSIANKTGLYAGNDDYTFNNNKSEYEYRKSGEELVTATATVYKIVAGQKVAFTATAAWESYKQEFDKRDSQGNKTGEKYLSDMWQKMGPFMLGKCAEALALRKAFPDELGGIYTDEEMAQANHATDVKYAQVVEEEEQPIVDPYKFKGEDKFQPKTLQGCLDFKATEKAIGWLRGQMEEKGLTSESVIKAMKIAAETHESKEIAASIPADSKTFYSSLNYFQWRWLKENVLKYQPKTESKEEIIAKGDKAAEELHG